MKFVPAIVGICLTAGLASSGQAQDQADAVIRGRYQAVLGDCGACHTKPGGRPYAGGEPLATPFGKLVPPNITSDRETGIGRWTVSEFKRMMKTGIGRDGAHLYPAMPYPAYALMPDRDLEDLWAYLTTVEPVSNKVIANQLPFPFNIRASLIGWNLLNFRSGEFRPDLSKSEQWNRGAYLVQGPAHCGACHTPKTLTGGDKSGAFLRGGALQGWFAPDITGDKVVGIGSWSEDELVQYLRTGATARTIASGPMAEAITNSTSKMMEADLRAIAIYLKALPGWNSGAGKPVSTGPAMAAGEAIYRDNCAGCHGMLGAGAPQLFPALSGNQVLAQSNAETLIRLLISGNQGGSTHAAPTAPAMPAFGWRLSDQQIADVLTYARNTWGNAAPPVSEKEVRSIRKDRE